MAVLFSLYAIQNCQKTEASSNLHDYSLTLERAEKYSKMAMYGIQKEYPYKDSHVQNAAEDLKLPRDYHPAFYGCFDWHSAVHGHWLLVYILKEFSGKLDHEKEIRHLLKENLTAEKMALEANYFLLPNTKSFERTYGWAWFLKLAEELYTWKDPEAEKWYKNIAPLEKIIVQRYRDFLPKQTYPIRRGVHPNTAFGIAFALDYARAVSNHELEKVLTEAAYYYYFDDANFPVNWEIEGDAFLSPALIEASLMSRILSNGEFEIWFRRFLPDFMENEQHILMAPATVTDRKDPKLVHLDGLNLSRVWCMAQIFDRLNVNQQGQISKAIIRHFDYSLPAVDSKYYEGSHWLATFAVYALRNTKKIN
ncbi:MAG: DUF2891 domain-containing protein [Candidatus Marinimicrobia bacterium]|nr:DUF2891 domain-containing protein [Candidatus Neomarinimicrobiota bacterium]